MSDNNVRIAYLNIIKDDLINNVILSNKNRLSIYKSIAYLNPIPLNNAFRYIGKTRQLANIQENRVADLEEAFSLLSLDKICLNYNINQLFRQFSSSNIEINIFTLLYEKCFSITVYRRMSYLINGEWGKIKELDEHDFIFQKSNLTNPANIELYNRWLYIQSLICLSYLSRIHMLSSNLIDDIDCAFYLNNNDYSLKKKMLLEYYDNQEQKYKLDTIIDEFYILIDYTIYLLNYSFSCEYFISKCKSGGFDFYDSFRRISLKSQYASNYAYSFVGESYVFNGFFDDTSIQICNMHIVNVILGITNCVLLKFVNVSSWSTHIQFNETYIQPFMDYFAKKSLNIINNSSIREEKKVHNIFDNNINFDNLERKDEKEDPLANLQLDENFFDFLSKTI